MRDRERISIACRETPLVVDERAMVELEREAERQARS